MRLEGVARVWLLLGGISGALAVGFGAYAAHGLAAGSEAAQWADKASRYQMYHALALLALAALGARTGRWGMAAGVLFVAGTCLFCGTLYVMALSGRPIGWLAPYGGTSFILGWLALGVAARVND